MKPAARIRIVGGGLAGVEAAYFLANRNVSVDLFEMRPATPTPAHKTDFLAELVCSNSLKGTDPVTAHGLLKREMALLDSLVIKAAGETQVPAGKALAVDREAFARTITSRIQSHDLITLDRREIIDIDPGILTIIATGPLTSEKLASRLTDITGSQRLYFYDAISPIVDAQSINLDKAFFGSRWDPASTDYLNCPIDRELYCTFVSELLQADRVNPRSFENSQFFDACLPIEVIASRGMDSLRFGPMRPVGFVDPATGRRPYALLQLRRENLKGDAYNLVGFQTRLTYPEQKRIFGMIPALSSAVFERFGSIHRNTFLDSPRVLNRDLTIKGYPLTLMAGQITGVEGYMESAATGILAGISALAKLRDTDFSPPGPDTASGALLHYITDENTAAFQPTNINLGIMESIDVHKKQRKQARLERETLSFKSWMESLKSLIRQ